MLAQHFGLAQIAVEQKEEEEEPSGELCDF